MQKIFWIGSPFFAASLPKEDFQVCCYNFEHLAVFNYDDLRDMAGFEPDVVVVADKSRPPFVLGMENIPCFTVFYAVDTHIHSWYPFYAQAFDACLVSLRDHIPLFYQGTLPKERIYWSPAFARDTDIPNAETLAYIDNFSYSSSASQSNCAPTNYAWDCLFVGTVNAATTPTRKIFLEQLATQVDLHTTRGDYTALFPQGRVIINHCEHGDLNFRVFEALACGCALVTPVVKHGFLDIFTHGKNIRCYHKENLQDAVDNIQHLLDNEEERLQMIVRGFELVHNAHRAKHRALAFAQTLRNLSPEYKKECVQKRLQNARRIREKWLRAPYLLLAEAQTEELLLREAYLKAAKGEFW